MYLKSKVIVLFAIFAVSSSVESTSANPWRGMQKIVSKVRKSKLPKLSSQKKVALLVGALAAGSFAFSVDVAISDADPEDYDFHARNTRFARDVLAVNPAEGARKIREAHHFMVYFHSPNDVDSEKAKLLELADFIEDRDGVLTPAETGKAMQTIARVEDSLQSKTVAAEHTRNWALGLMAISLAQGAGGAYLWHHQPAKNGESRTEPQQAKTKR